jgi:alpha-D-ribose 1-methylphosphonate 5-triphosphate synthase subunit PhnH
MAIDQVHDLQQVFRKILHSMSRPGTISSIEAAAEQADYNLPCYDATLLCAMTLLDAEVSFHILSESHQDLIEKISEYTLAKHKPIHEADFVIVLRDDTENAIKNAIEQCKNGNLINPQSSSTWIIESSPLTNNGPLTLMGPGIQTSEQLQVSFTSSMWNARNKRTKEYPLGIDIIFVDDQAQIACVPRTTSVEWVVN